MNLSSIFSIAVLLAAVPAIHAETIATFTGNELTAADPTQLGRLSRDAVPQTWSGAESFPGEINTTTIYYYTTYVLPASDFVGAPYVEINFQDSVSGADLFTSAYLNSYIPSFPPLSLATNWLGDAGSSGSDQTFDVVLPVGNNLIVVVNNTAAGLGGLNEPFQITVSAFADTNRDDPSTGATAATPEPGTIFTLGTGLLGLGGILRRRIGGSH